MHVKFYVFLNTGEKQQLSLILTSFALFRLSELNWFVLWDWICSTMLSNNWKNEKKINTFISNFKKIYHGKFIIQGASYWKYM